MNNTAFPAPRQCTTVVDFKCGGCGDSLPFDTAINYVPKPDDALVSCTCGHVRVPAACIPARRT